VSAAPTTASRGEFLLDFSGLTAATVEIPFPGPLLGLLPRIGGLAWLREGEGIVGWGEVARLDTSGPRRFDEARAWWDLVISTASVRDEVHLPGTGLVAFGTFGFGPEAVSADSDGTVRPSTMIVPRVIVGHRAGRWWRTTISPGTSASAPSTDDLATDDLAIDERLAGDSLTRFTEPIRPLGQVEWSDGACSAAAWPAVVASAVQAISEGRADKVVLARDQVADAQQPIDVRAPLITLAQRYPSCWTYAVDGLIGATPEMLVRLEQGVAHSRVLAGTIRREPESLGGPLASAPAVLASTLLASAKDRREHEFSVRSVADALGPHCRELTVPQTPFVLTLPNVLHLASDISGEVTDGSTALQLAQALHPTAAVCGSPADAAAKLIDALEPMRRGRYAGPVGWESSSGDGEWGIALRCGQVDANDPRRVRIFAGGGIVAGSEPESELAETTAKFRPMVEALGG
jgi:menaquinone-specific isochorismate synthase